jgi:hypothetical protein
VAKVAAIVVFPTLSSPRKRIDHVSILYVTKVCDGSSAAPRILGVEGSFGLGKAKWGRD